jgi:hypothetical protein
MSLMVACCVFSGTDWIIKYYLDVILLHFLFISYLYKFVNTVELWQGPSILKHDISDLLSERVPDDYKDSKRQERLNSGHEPGKGSTPRLIDSLSVVQWCWQTDWLGFKGLKRLCWKMWNISATFLRVRSLMMVLFSCETVYSFTANGFHLCRIQWRTVSDQFRILHNMGLRDLFMSPSMFRTVEFTGKHELKMWLVWRIQVMSKEFSKSLFKAHEQEIIK